MPLPPPTDKRTRVHCRRVTFEGFQRDDGLWDIEGHMTDTKDRDFPLRHGILKPGEPVHDMSVRVTVDNDMNVIDVATCSDATPYPGVCGTINPEYRKIIGLNLFKGFLHSIKEMFGGKEGCSHVSELLMGIPTAALQTFANPDTENRSETKPFYLDRCHALSTESDVVRRYYPRWYRNPNSG